MAITLTPIWLEEFEHNPVDWGSFCAVFWVFSLPMHAGIGSSSVEEISSGVFVKTLCVALSEHTDEIVFF